MNAEQVLKIYSDLEKRDIKIWLDGGWGVDALLKKQTREHDDVDIVIQEKNLEKAVSYFRELGFKDAPRDDTCAWNFALGNDEGNEVDFHVIKIDKKGNGIYGPEQNGDFYPKSSLEGKGAINNVSVRCLSPEYQLISHTGYKLREKDYIDIKNICEKFDLVPPNEK